MADRTPANLEATAIRVMAPAIVDRLRLAFPEKFFGIERVPSTLSMTEYKRLVRLSPFIGLSWVGFKKDGTSGRILKGRHQWRLTLIVRASNGLEARFMGDHSDIGLDAMVDVSMVLLQGAVFPNIGDVSVNDANAVYAEGAEDDDVALAHLNFEISYSAPLSDLKLLDASNLETLQITWSLDGEANEGGHPHNNQTINLSQNEEDENGED